MEVLSPSTRHVDLGLKRSAYEALGTAHYWVLDPGVPSLIAWELIDGRYVEAGHVAGAEVLTLEQPFPIRIAPADLLT